MYYPQVGNQSLCLFISCTEVSQFLYLKYFLNKDEVFRGFILILYYSLIQNEFLGNSSDIGNLESLIENKRVHHLKTAPAHLNECRVSNWICSAE